MSDNEKIIVLTLTIYPAKNGKRRVMVSGAPEGEMPEVTLGQFADRHALMDGMYTKLLKRKPKAVKVKESKPDSSPSSDEAHQPGEGDATLRTPPTGELPEIEGDTASRPSDHVAFDEAQADLMKPDSEQSTLPFVK